MKTIILCGGGTAGHIIPNLALYHELKDYFSNVIYLGEKNSMEEKMARDAGIEFLPINSVKFDRTNYLKNFSVICKLKKYVNECCSILKSTCADVVFSKGGYVSLPVTLSAKKLNIPYCIHESDLTMGLANKIVANKASVVFTNFEKTYHGKKHRPIGIPMRRDLFCNISQKDLLREYSLPNRKTILITGGSLGAQKINDVISLVYRDLTKKYNVIHLTGKGKSTKNCAHGYKQLEFSKEMGKLYKMADLTISRAGATTIAELCALNKKAILIPLSKSASRGDQIKNAIEVSNSQNFEVIFEENLTPQSLLNAVDKMMDKEITRRIEYKNPSLEIAEVLYELTLK
ncbi:MAG: UDP-N-acetylglucosamine--N-acetylmuramyl-(pentapeptide) pyrophosphoryl-undecaprenol N-acetylglucosamine transferase [Clostridia bacterium]|nr:UDP-N-acetylglucosamine--N-acetylmuramyl-(pentapeptide) pyrophosphoryl-undecaprenol N-acetylglucosamine transferase [Clostridia bacterium]